MATYVEHLHVQFGIAATSVTERDASGAGLIGKFWILKLKNGFCHVVKWGYCFSNILRTESFHFGPDPKRGYGFTTQIRILTIVYYI